MKILTIIAGSILLAYLYLWWRYDEAADIEKMQRNWEWKQP
ncbi:MAG TPA: hypothetical protein VFH87_01715 [Candidatus Udaeobacter sp.]|nr:hypothetical protein [Candidatus Udaeobacter sp.]